MQKWNRVMALGTALCAAALAGALALHTRSVQEEAANVLVYSTADPTSSQEMRSNRAESTTQAGSAYTVRAFEGEIGVFKGGADTPFEVYAVDVDTLPAADRFLLNAGIPAENRQEVRRILEDYLS